MSTQPERPVRVDMDAKACLLQIEQGVLWSVGAHSMALYKDALVFVARLHPYNKTGERAGMPRNMHVEVTLSPSDLYVVRVVYPARKGSATSAPIVHFQSMELYADQLSPCILSLDSGTEKEWAE